MPPDAVPPSALLPPELVELPAAPPEFLEPAAPPAFVPPSDPALPPDDGAPALPPLAPDVPPLLAVAPPVVAAPLGGEPELSDEQPRRSIIGATRQTRDSAELIVTSRS